MLLPDTGHKEVLAHLAEGSSSDRADDLVPFRFVQAVGLRVEWHPVQAQPECRNHPRTVPLIRTCEVTAWSSVRCCRGGALCASITPEMRVDSSLLVGEVRRTLKKDSCSRMRTVQGSHHPIVAIMFPAKDKLHSY